uniref:Anaphase-promoting complex subunit 13 n=1 Tax=Chelydra serpentina TaxID=8475 RepID=A0A8C3T7J3_CHESE
MVRAAECRRSRGFLLGPLAGDGARAGCQVRGLGPDVGGDGSLPARREGYKTGHRRCCGPLSPGRAEAANTTRDRGRDCVGTAGARRIYLYVNCTKMDSEVQRDGRILDLIDDAWREDKLPYEDVAIPLNELPEPEQDNGGTTESVKEQEMKWTDLALQYLHENVPPTGN